MSGSFEEPELSILYEILIQFRIPNFCNDIRVESPILFWLQVFIVFTFFPPHLLHLQEPYLIPLLGKIGLGIFPRYKHVTTGQTG